MNAGDLKIILVTYPAADPKAPPAKEFARALVEGRLAACVNVVPALTSVYRWEGKVCADEETLLIVKTWANQVSALEQYILKHHPYSTPEFVVLTPEFVTEKYLDWARVQSV